MNTTKKPDTIELDWGALDGFIEENNGKPEGAITAIDIMRKYNLPETTARRKFSGLYNSGKYERGRYLDYGHWIRYVVIGTVAQPH